MIRESYDIIFKKVLLTKKACEMNFQSFIEALELVAKKVKYLIRISSYSNKVALN
jgi:hypothetical protein